MELLNLACDLRPTSARFPNAKSAPPATLETFSLGADNDLAHHHRYAQSGDRPHRHAR
ncbi:hypothetical protein KL86PLE_10089 [uncultured Pleomorphomonas sp.]|uniref:Uncharacterized protein n=1 Tax=uncultured Pleomorphomonas sp. TaxID=442121 RepID=A0A212KYC3_9HYPH|nr:hypothetical protein KL86PLE_10089 [uncultured Pleomorphomonas sp.]